jgi:hypothetical protein
MAWTDEKRKLVVDSYVTTMETEYTTDEDRAKSSVEVVKDLADTHGETPNGVRQMLWRTVRLRLTLGWSPPAPVSCRRLKFQTGTLPVAAPRMRTR